jgi:hypothetical protein
MRLMVGLCAGLLALATLGITAAEAQQYPSVGNLQPFSAQTNYMSLPGYLRYLVHQQQGTWLTYAEASRIVDQQRKQ